MWLLYLISIIPFALGAYFWLNRHEIVWWEWLLGGIAAPLTVLAVHAMVIHGMVADQETLSGYVTKAVFNPEWVEMYYYTTCTSCGKSTCCTTHTAYRTHPDDWDAYDSLGQPIDISKEKFKEMADKFGNYCKEDGNKVIFVSGDPNIYVSYNRTHAVHYPTTMQQYWENVIKATRSIYSFRQLNEEEKKKVFEYPNNDNVWVSNRLLGTAKHTINIKKFDQMNAQLGQPKHVNVIMVGFDHNSDASVGRLLEEHWLRGKKNDLVITYGGGTALRPAWSYVFGWTDKNIVKANLASIVLENPVNDSILPKIQKEIVRNYQIKNWKDFNYLQVEPPTWAFILILIVVIGTQVGYWIFAHNNDVDKDDYYY